MRGKDRKGSGRGRGQESSLEATQSGLHCIPGTRRSHWKTSVVGHPAPGEGPEQSREGSAAGGREGDGDCRTSPEPAQLCPHMPYDVLCCTCSAKLMGSLPVGLGLPGRATGLSPWR